MVRSSFVLCDVFAERPFVGNQLAVFVDASRIPEQQLGTIAREFNFSEVAFLYPARRGGDARVRIFTPAAEIPFAGHPTLGAAAVVGMSRDLALVHLESGVGAIEVRLKGRNERSTFGWMRQLIPTVTDFQSAPELLAVLGVERSTLPVQLYDNGLRHVFIGVHDEDAVAALEPNFAAIAEVINATGLHAGVNCFAGGGDRWKTRMFAPADGVLEDPATGSAAGPLTCHLMRHRAINPGQPILIAQGAEIGRPSQLHARVTGSPNRIKSVDVGGVVQFIGEGELSW